MTYLSPKTLFFVNPDIDLQHTIPKVSLAYDWMVIPYLIGFYLLIKRLKQTNYKFIGLYALLTLIPAVFSGYFYSSQRSLAFIVPLMVIIGLGLDEIASKLSKRIYLLALALVGVYSLVMLYSSYFVLFPKERAVAWNYGYDQVAIFIAQNPDTHFFVDDTRNPRAYSLLLYYLKVDPSEYQKEVDSKYRDNYYQAYDPAPVYVFGNVVVKQLDWEKDVSANIDIIGDNLSISDQQAKEHNLVEIKEIKDPLGQIIFKIWKYQL